MNSSSIKRLEHIKQLLRLKSVPVALTVAAILVVFAFSASVAVKNLSSSKKEAQKVVIPLKSQTTTPTPIESGPTPTQSTLTATETPKPTSQALPTRVLTTTQAITPTSNPFPTTYQPSRSGLYIDTITPSSTSYDHSVNILGNGFGSSPREVRFKNVTNTAIPSFSYKYLQGIISWKPTEVVVWSPADKGKYEIQVEGENGLVTNTMYLDVIAGPPSVTSTSSQVYESGKQIAVYGKEFGNSQGEVRVNEYNGPQVGMCSINSWNDTQIVCTLPSGIVSGKQYGLYVITSDSRHAAPVFHSGA